MREINGILVDDEVIDVADAAIESVDRAKIMIEMKPREAEIVKMLQGGIPISEIATTCGERLRTVYRILEKLSKAYSI